MARRRRVDPPTPEPTACLPERLARFDADDWVAPGEIPPHLPTTVNGSPPDAAYIAEALEVVAWRRHRRALRLWQVERSTRSTP